TYGLRNTSLISWVVALVVAIAGLGVIGTYGLVAIQKSTDTYSQQVAELQSTLQAQKLAQTEKKVTDISNSFKLVVQVLSKEVLFSQLLKQIATVIPPNASLANLNISQTTGGVDIVANASDYTTATQVQINLADPNNKIFSKADLVSITCNNGTANARYPCTVQIRALFATKNPFLFINNTTGEK
ncbi:MAG TPA: hypothetical protein VFH39_01215, partial [Candidatus Saccharimonadales bacterium]|nr:hypothetical protein [Candidatus Saccharimonadales bacterium]